MIQAQQKTLTETVGLHTAQLASNSEDIASINARVQTLENDPKTSPHIEKLEIEMNNLAQRLQEFSRQRVSSAPPSSRAPLPPRDSSRASTLSPTRPRATVPAAHAASVDLEVDWNRLWLKPFWLKPFGSSHSKMSGETSWDALKASKAEAALPPWCPASSKLVQLLLRRPFLGPAICTPPCLHNAYGYIIPIKAKPWHCYGEAIYFQDLLNHTSQCMYKFLSKASVGRQEDPLWIPHVYIYIFIHIYHIYHTYIYIIYIIYMIYIIYIHIYHIYISHIYISYISYIYIYNISIISIYLI